jgi:uncharacterized membrane protein YsdA (DUF1294 family)
MFSLLLTFTIGWYGVASLVTFLAYAYDKHKAQTDTWRLKEQTLHTLEKFGGWPGGLAAQQLLRHKRRKAAYMAVFWRIVAMHVGAWFLIVVIKYG